MRQRTPSKLPWIIVLALGASAAPASGWTHFEGVEAADPSTPAAVLRLESAASRYSGLNAKPVPWPTLFEQIVHEARESSVAGAIAPPALADDAQRTPATTGQ